MFYVHVSLSGEGFSLQEKMAILSVHEFTSVIRTRGDHTRISTSPCDGQRTPLPGPPPLGTNERAVARRKQQVKREPLSSIYQQAMTARSDLIVWRRHGRQQVNQQLDNCVHGGGCWVLNRTFMVFTLKATQISSFNVTVKHGTVPAPTSVLFVLCL